MLNGLSNDILGVRTVCSTDLKGSLYFTGNQGLGKFEYRIDFAVGSEVES